MQAARTRAEAVQIARSWKGTPYILKGRVKGAGIDCGTLLAEYLIEAGRATRADMEDLGFYSHDWFCHESSERYLLRLMRHAHLVGETVCQHGRKEARPGCIVTFKTVGSHVYNHGAIVTTWPFGVHAQQPCVKEVDLVSHWLTNGRQMDVFDIFGGDDGVL